MFEKIWKDLSVGVGYQEARRSYLCITSRPGLLTPVAPIRWTPLGRWRLFCNSWIGLPEPGPYLEQTKKGRRENLAG